MANVDANAMPLGLKENDQFNTYIDFKEALDNYCESNFVNYTIVDSETVEKANSKLKAKTAPFKKEFVYRYIKFQCKHMHGAKNKEKTGKGLGTRPNQR